MTDEINNSGNDGSHSVPDSISKQFNRETSHDARSADGTVPPQGAITPGGIASPLQMALLGGLAASIVAGAVWGTIVVISGWELGIVAWLVGLAVGYAIVMFSKGERGLTQQIVAVPFSIFGIMIGKYFAFYGFYKDYFAEQYGEAAASAQISVFSSEMFGLFWDNLGEMLGGMDILWVVLACVSAWKTAGAPRK